MAADSSTTDVKIRPILCSGPMVRALLSGQMTQTRRVINPQPAPFVQATPDSHPPARPEPYLDSYCGEKKTPENPRGMSRDWCWWTRDNRPGPTVARCPYGVPGDRLWVRETWGYYPGSLPGEEPLLYRADCPEAPGDWPSYRRGPIADFVVWKPSIHMPRWASRLTLEVTEVRVQRLTSITDEDAIAEGVEQLDRPGFWKAYDCREGFCTTAARSFETLWQSINAKRAPWDSNPLVWAISFKVIR